MTREQLAEALKVVRERSDLAQIVRDAGVELSPFRTRSLAGACPFCGVEAQYTGEPAFAVHPSRGFFHCFECKESGSAIDFVMKRHGSNLLEAVWWLTLRLMPEELERYR